MRYDRHSSDNRRCECDDLECFFHPGEPCDQEAEGVMTVHSVDTSDEKPWEAEYCAGCTANTYDVIEIGGFSWELHESHAGRCDFDANLRCRVCGAAFPGYHDRIPADVKLAGYQNAVALSDSCGATTVADYITREGQKEH